MFLKEILISILWAFSNYLCFQMLYWKQFLLQYQNDISLCKQYDHNIRIAKIGFVFNVRQLLQRNTCFVKRDFWCDVRLLFTYNSFGMCYCAGGWTQDLIHAEANILALSYNYPALLYLLKKIFHSFLVIFTVTEKRNVIVSGMISIKVIYP